jgi:hypothetical protein
MSTYLRRTCTGGNQKIATFSAWVKKTQITQENCLFLQRADSSNFFRIRFNSDQINFNSRVSGSDVYGTTDAVFRDPSAFYHIVLTVDTTQNTEADRFKLYVNNSQQTFSASSYPSQHADLQMNVNSMQNDIGGENGYNYFKGLMTHIHWVDGTAYTPSTFGETDSTSGIWKPKTAPSVTYGTNGFFLKFENSGAMGTDSSGNSNTFTVSGTLTQNVDTPSNNFATLNPLDNYYANMTFSQGNNTTVSDHPAPSVSTLGMTSGKYYFEAKAITSTSGNDWQIGIVSTQVTATSNEIGHFANDYSYVGASGKYRNNDGNTNYGNTYTAGDIIGCAVDLTNNKLYFSKNGTWQNSGVPTSGSTGTGAISITAPTWVSVSTGITPLGAYFVAVGANASANDYTWSMNFGNGYFGTTAVASAGTAPSEGGIFEYDCPSGYQALCTKGINSF